MYLYLSLLIPLTISFVLTFYIRKLAIKKKLVDMPNKRSSHSIPTPRLGGLAIVITWFTTLTIFYFLKIIEPKLFFSLSSGILIAIISLIDDIRTLSSKIRLAVHFCASALAFFFLGGLRQFTTFDIGFNYIYIIYPIFIIAMVWFINLFNFMDGIDGYASNEAISISLILFIFSGTPLPLLLIACISGFLYWNLSSRKIFMGDIGSTQLGFILIVLGLYFHNEFYVSILNWFMIAAPFLFDATFTLYLRWKNKEPLSEAHKKHAYQRLVQAGYSHKKVNILLILLNISIFALIFIYREFDFLKVPLSILTFFYLFFLYKKINKLVPFK